MADFSISAELKANASQFVSELKKGESSVNSFGGVIDKILGPKGKLVLALAAATTAAVKFGQSMNASMSEIAKGTGATGKDLEKLRESVHNSLVNGVAQSAKEVGKMIADLNTRFGVTGKELEILTKEFSNFSKVTGVDTASAINLTADVMKKWNIETEDTEKLLDQLTSASQASGAGVEELLSGLKQGEAVFSQFGMSASDSIAYMASLKSNGIEVSKALTGMQLALAKFSQQGIDAQEGMQAVSDAIKNAASDTEALNIAVETFGTRNGAEMVKVLREGATSADVFKEAIMNAGGAVEATREASRTSADAFAELKAALEGSFGGFGEGFDELFKGIIDSVAEFVRMLDPVIRPISSIFREILGTAGGLVKELVSAIATLTKGSAGFNSLAVALQNTYEMIHETLGYILDVFKDTFGLIFSIINGKWDLAWEYLKKILLENVKYVFDILSELLNSLKDQFNVFIEKVINPFIEKVNWWEEKLNKPLTQKFEPIGNVNLSKITGIEKAIEKTQKKIQQLSGKTTDKITGDLGQVQKSTNKATDDITDNFENATESAEETTSVMEQMSKVVKENLKTAFGDAFKELGEGLADGELAFENMGATAVNAVSEILAALGSQLMAIAALKASTQDYASAAIATAGAAAAFTASGVLAGVASNMKKSADSMKDAASSLSSVLKKITEIKDELSFSSLYSSLVDYNNLLEEAIATQEEWQWYFENTVNAFNFKYIKENLEDSVEAVEEIENAIAKIYTDTIDNLNEENDALQKQIEFYQDMYNNLYMIDIVEGTMRSSLKNMIVEAWADVANIGANIGEAFIDAFLDGASEADFASSLKDLIRTNLIKTSVLTTELEEQIAESSTRLVTAIANKNYEEIESISDYMRELYREYENVADGIDEVLNGIFEDTVETVESITDSIEEMGTTISESLVDAMVNGLEQGEFLDTMKNYVRKMVIQTVVYTESLQSQIEAIGVAISEGIANGFSESGLDKLRMDFSYLFYQAENSMSKIDSVLNAVFDGYATGTDNATAGLHLVGEAGPELVRFRGGEQVYNANETAKMLNGGNGGNNFNVSFYNMQDTTAYTMLQQLKQYNREMAVNGII